MRGTEKGKDSPERGLLEGDIKGRSNQASDKRPRRGSLKRKGDGSLHPLRISKSVKGMSLPKRGRFLSCYCAGRIRPGVENNFLDAFSFSPFQAISIKVRSILPGELHISVCSRL